jgi:GH15 family glucan-1,4-alpha-glucosidase
MNVRAFLKHCNRLVSVRRLAKRPARREEARSIYERLLGRSSDLGLFAEQLDATTDEHRGNYPQAFTHMAVVNHALRLV